MANSRPKRGSDDEPKEGSKRFFKQASEDASYVGFIRVSKDLNEAFGALAQIASVAAVAVMYGFNRSGGITVSIYCEGTSEKEYYSSDEHFLATWHDLYNGIFDYCQDKQTKRFSKAVTLELVESHKG